MRTSEANAKRGPVHDNEYLDGSCQGAGCARGVMLRAVGEGLSIKGYLKRVVCQHGCH